MPWARDAEDKVKEKRKVTKDQEVGQDLMTMRADQLVSRIRSVIHADTLIWPVKLVNQSTPTNSQFQLPTRTKY